VRNIPYAEGILSVLRGFGFDKTAGYWQNIVGFDDLDTFRQERQKALQAEKALYDYEKAREVAADEAVGTMKAPSLRGTRSAVRKGTLIGSGLGGSLGAGVGLAAFKGRPLFRAATGGAIGLLAGGLGGAQIASWMRGGGVKGSVDLGKKEDAYNARLQKRREFYDKYDAEHPYPGDIYDFSADPFKGRELGWFDKYVSVPQLVGGSENEGFSDQPTGKGYLSRNDLLGLLQGDMKNYGDKGWAALDGSSDSKLDLVEAIRKSPYQYFTSTEAG